MRLFSLCVLSLVLLAGCGRGSDDAKVVPNEPSGATSDGLDARTGLTFALVGSSLTVSLTEGVVPATREALADSPLEIYCLAASEDPLNAPTFEATSPPLAPGVDEITVELVPSPEGDVISCGVESKTMGSIASGYFPEAARAIGSATPGLKKPDPSNRADMPPRWTGSGKAEKKVAAVALSFEQLMNAGNGKRACALLDPKVFGNFGAADCPQAMTSSLGSRSIEPLAEIYVTSVKPAGGYGEPAGSLEVCVVQDQGHELEQTNCYGVDHAGRIVSVS
jgi:hypothetical protein